MLKTHLRCHLEGCWSRDAHGWRSQARTHPDVAWRIQRGQRLRRIVSEALWELPGTRFGARGLDEVLEAQMLPAELESLVEQCC